MSHEMKRLEAAAAASTEAANAVFDEATALLEKRRQNAVREIRDIASAKKEKLKEQLELIEKERCKVKKTCNGLEYQVEVKWHNLTHIDMNEAYYQQSYGTLNIVPYYSQPIVIVSLTLMVIP